MLAGCTDVTGRDELQRVKGWQLRGHTARERRAGSLLSSEIGHGKSI